jgi:hypothetical protein
MIDYLTSEHEHERFDNLRALGAALDTLVSVGKQIFNSTQPGQGEREVTQPHRLA